jgi:hypothetical protein
LLGILPFLANLLTQSLQGVGGTWLATPKDILVLFLLWASGFAPVREYFLDSTHLVLPAMADISMLTWAAIGMAISGFPVAWGMYRTWRKKSRYRLDVLLALMLILLPVALVFYYLDQTVPAYAILTENGKQKFVFQILHSDQQILGSRQEIPCKELSA